MVTQTWMYDAIIYIYALSLLFYFSDFVRINRSAKRVGAGLLVFVWVFETAYLVLAVYRQTFSPFYSMSETLLLFSWLLVGVSLAIDRFFRIEMFVFLVNVFGLAVLALNLFAGSNSQLPAGTWRVSDELLFIHVTLAVGSYTAFAAGAVFSGMHLFLHKRLKGRQWSSSLRRLPSLEKTDRYAFRSVIVGTPLLIAALALGLVWVVLHGDRGLILDSKVLATLFILGTYLYYLFLKTSSRAEGTKLAVWSLAAFGLVVLNLIVSNWFSAFHQWVGM